MRRHSGTSTRIADKAIQDIFEKIRSTSNNRIEVHVQDVYVKHTFDIIKGRLIREHRFDERAINEIYMDISNCIITISLGSKIGGYLISGIDTAMHDKDSTVFGKFQNNRVSINIPERKSKHYFDASATFYEPFREIQKDLTDRMVEHINEGMRKLNASVLPRVVPIKTEPDTKLDVFKKTKIRKAGKKYNSNENSET